MLTQILLTTIVIPLLFGIVIALLSTAHTPIRIIISAFLIPVAAAVVSVLIEGMPPFPPIAAKQKLPMLLLIGGVAFATLATLSKLRLNRRLGTLVCVISLALPAWWLGRNVLAANSVKAITLGVVLVIIAFAMMTVTDVRARRPMPAALPAALLAGAIGTALAAVIGGYIGMAQMNGALAALFGGWLLVRFIAYLRGDDEAFILQEAEALSFLWTATMGVAMTVLFTPNATPAALVLCALPSAVFIFLTWKSVSFPKLPRFSRPLLAGVLTGFPAIIAILVAILAIG